MTDNSDFMTRYLRSDDNDRREQPTPPPVDDEGLTVVEPEISPPAAPQRMPTPAGGYESGAADTGPRPRIGGGPAGLQLITDRREGQRGAEWY